MGADFLEQQYCVRPAHSTNESDLHGRDQQSSSQFFSLGKVRNGGDGVGDLEKREVRFRNPQSHCVRNLVNRFPSRG